MNQKSCIIEFQAFRGNNDKFIIKELVILDLLTFVVYPFTFEAPFSYNCLNAKARKTNDWLTKYFHYINWYDGFITYSNLHSIMFQFCKQFPKIYTRGLEKTTWIQSYTKDEVVNVHVPKCFKNRFENICVTINNPKHGKTHCALRNAYFLAEYLQKEWKCDSVEYKYGATIQPEYQSNSRLSRSSTASPVSNSEKNVESISGISC